MEYINVFNEFKKLCSNQQIECAIACRVYMDLILDKKYDSIVKCYNSSLNVFYLKAESWEKEKFIILPSLISRDLDLNIIHKLQSEEHESSKFLLALCDTSSNILYYRKFGD